MHELAGEPSRVVKDFITPISEMDEVFEGLVLAGANVRALLAGEPITLAWPQEIVVSGREITGYVMPSIPDQFYWQDKKFFRGKRRVRELQYAVRRESAVSIPFRADDTHRLELVRLVAAFLEAMHREELVYGDLSWGNLAFSVGDKVELCVFDFDSTRQVGRPAFTRQRPAQTVDWNDPEDRSRAVASFDSDRYKFALLVYRLLVAHDFDSRPEDATRVGSISGLDQRGVHGLQSLLRRAAGHAGTRPQISEWLAVLQR
ncbi:hypothetical protein K1X13_14110 [Nocardioides sp. WL0053]|uniref:Protein kinase domain-containing protein n=1 Tax=Nocardioides jiangsuensis TaxID=2866161 RepID=A0ABS7RLM6_9ACTN|nr:hypothetical protein [Nocardioides jiangsuensis]MBY9075964.1 hypothetical protein [Nocardioides jiangsuensis]